MVNALLDRVSRARIPTASLASLAGLRDVAGISVLSEDEFSWVTWPVGNDRVLRAVLPIEGVELWECREGRWYSPGCRLPSFDILSDLPAIGLAQAVIPSPFSSDPPPEVGPSRVELRLVPDGRPRATSATLCRLSDLGAWAEGATSAQIVGISGAVSGELVFLMGSNLPIWPDAVRYWGAKVLVPIGFDPWPRLPEDVIRDVVGAGPGDIVRLDGTGSGPAFEMIPVASMRPMTRAGIRLAVGGFPHEP